MINENQSVTTESVPNEETENNDLFEHIDTMQLSFTSWLDNIVRNVENVVLLHDNGDRDNLMFNTSFAKHFLRLCKMLPLWSAICIDFFNISDITSSSANVESYFKEVKQSFKDFIPCSVDKFMVEILDMTKSMIIEASHNSKYVRFIGDIPINETSDEEINDSTSFTANIETTEDLSSSGLNDTDEHERSKNATGKQSASIIGNTRKNKTNTNDSTISNLHGIDDQSKNARKNQSIHSIACVACANNDEPTGAHKCAVCGKNVHVFPECSVTCGDAEGYGEKRICISCHESENAVPKSSQEMHYKETWGKKPQKTSSKYMRAMPNWSLNTNINKKTKIGLLRNGNLTSTTHKAGSREVVGLTNTCTVDSFMQVDTIIIDKLFEKYMNRTNILFILAIGRRIRISSILQKIYGFKK